MHRGKQLILRHDNVRARIVGVDVYAVNVMQFSVITLRTIMVILMQLFVWEFIVFI